MVEFEPHAGEPGARGTLCAQACYEDGVLGCASGDLIVLSPPLIIEVEQIDQMVNGIRRAIKQMN